MFYLKIKMNILFFYISFRYNIIALLRLSLHYSKKIRVKYMKLYLYNSLTKDKQLFIPINPDNIRMYVCGPTVYDYPHLGNALAVVIYDVLLRLLQFIYGIDKVNYIRNITDVDDKIINASLTQNIPISRLTEKISKIFQDNMKQLNCLDPNFEPKATEHIPEMISMIENLITNGYAYESKGHVYFRVHKYNKYGKLSGRNLEDLISGSRIEISELKENAEDFVLWKPTKEVDHSFDSPFGLGRPGWHIECSAMSYKYLGESFDIHGGGVDLIFPHHTNEIAQSCCANLGSEYAKYWVHNGFLTVNGEKMSKSLGNFITTQDLLDSGINGEVIRYVLLSSHYRKPIDWNDKSLADAKKSLDSFYRVLQYSKTTENISIPEDFLSSLLDDLNTPQSFATLHKYVTQFYKADDEGEKQNIIAKLRSCGQLLGILDQDPQTWFTDIDIDHEYIEEQIEKRIMAKSNKDWQLADKIRQELRDLNIILEDKADGSSLWRKG